MKRIFQFILYSIVYALMAFRFAYMEHIVQDIGGSKLAECCGVWFRL